MPLINHNFTANQNLYQHVSLTSETLDWEDDHTLLISKYELGHDIIMQVPSAQVLRLHTSTNLERIQNGGRNLQHGHVPRSPTNA